MSIQGFLSDRSLIDPTLSTINLETVNFQCGVLDRSTIEYFVQPLEINDLRPSRLPILYRADTGAGVNFDTVLADIDSTVENAGLTNLASNPTQTVAYGQYASLNYLDFLGDTLPTVPTALAATGQLLITTDATQLTAADTTAISSMTPAQQNNLMNIVEYLTYGTLSTDSQTDINAALLNSASFTGYVASSIFISTQRDEAFVYGGLNIHRFVPTSFTFGFLIGTYHISVTIWVDVVAFRSQYPYSTIIDVVPPMSLPVLLNPASIPTDPIAAVIISKGWSDTNLTPEMDTQDQSGMYLFPTRYIYNGNTYQVTFCLVYRGQAPDLLSARTYLANYLINSGVGTRALWELVLPDIFYTSAFALIPFYDNVTVLTNTDVYPSIINATNLLAKMNSLMNLVPKAANQTDREFMTAAYNTYLIGVAPADANVAPSLLSLHPTYQDFSTTDAGFIDMTTDDRNWSVLLNQALSVAAGGTNNLTTSVVADGGLNWVNFLYNSVSYLILTQASYTEFFAAHPLTS